MMDANNPLGIMRHPHQEAAAAAVFADQQMSYHGGGGGVGGGGSSPSLGGGAVSFDGKSQLATAVFESASGGDFQANLHGISIEWTPEEQAILDEGLVQYATETNIVRYAKIAVQLKNKTVRDVALRCRWMARRDLGKRRKDELSSMRKGKERKEKVSDPSAVQSHAAMPSGFAAYGHGWGHGAIANGNDARISYAAIGGIMGQLLQQNAQTFERISANLATNQMHENIDLLSRARSNILHILNNLSDPPNLMKPMPPLPIKINDGLANSILPIQ